MDDLLPEDLSKVDHTEYLINKLFSRYLISSYYTKNVGNKVEIHVFEKYALEKINCLIERELVNNKNYIEILDHSPKKRSNDDWLSYLGDGRESVD